MKNNNKGFIAISLIYSFFLAFLIFLLVVINNYANNRVLLNDVKKETQEYLNGLAEFNPVHLKNKTYVTNEEVVFGREKWKVIKDNGNEVILILSRNLKEEEINEALTEEGISSVTNGNRVLMCFNGYNPALCNYQDTITFNYYTWNTSIVKKIIDKWFEQDPNLEKAIAIDSLQEMDFTDGNRNYDSYIRIPNASEFSLINDNNIWYLTTGSETNGISYIRVGDNLVSAHTTYKNIRPVIQVKKSI